MEAGAEIDFGATVRVFLVAGNIGASSVELTPLIETTVDVDVEEGAEGAKVMLLAVPNGKIDVVAATVEVAVAARLLAKRMEVEPKVPGAANGMVEVEREVGFVVV